MFIDLRPYGVISTARSVPTPLEGILKTRGLEKSGARKSEGSVPNGRVVNEELHRTRRSEEGGLGIGSRLTVGGVCGRTEK